MDKGWLWGLALSLVMLGGCGVKSEEPPVVLAKMTQVMSQMERMEFSGDFQVVGKSTLPLFQGLQDLQITGTGRVDLSAANNFRYLLNLVISGMGSEGKTEIGAELRSFPDINYFRITRITMPMGLPFSLSADNKWYQIKSGGQNQDWLGSSQPLTDDQLQQLRELLNQNQLFNVVQKFPDETVNGARVYHWQVAFDPEALKTLLRNWGNITNPATEANVEHWATMLSDYTYEFWINKYDHRIMKASIKGWYNSEQNQRVDFTVNLNINKFNTAQVIERPANVAEFNLREMLGLPNLTQ